MPFDDTEVRLESDDFSCDRLSVLTLDGHEAISRPFSFDLLVAVPEPGFEDTAALLGAEVSIVFELAGAERRRVHGMISAVEDPLDSEPEFRSYRLRVTPRITRLSLIETQELFVDASVPEIIADKLSRVDLGPEDVELHLLGEYPKRDLVVQYRETDLAFVSRLAEHLGISFFFQHRDGRDVLVFSDHPDGFGEVERPGPIPFQARGEQVDVFRFTSKQELVPSMWAVQDYNYRTPQLEITGVHEHQQGYAGGVVEYGAHHRTKQAGEALAKVRAQEREARCRFYEGESDVPALAAGARFSLGGHPRLPDPKHLLVVEVTHAVTQSAVTRGSQAVRRYRNTFRAIDAERTYRPPRATPRPRIHGVVSALVEPRRDGQFGQIAELDEHGRYTLKFYFDTEPLGKKPRSSHRVRMIQQHAGPGYGTHLPLKAGVEVLVTFVDGDPDRPIIVGGAPNHISPSPVTVTEPLVHRTKTASGIVVEMKDHF